MSIRHNPRDRRGWRLAVRTGQLDELQVSCWRLVGFATGDPTPSTRVRDYRN